MLCLGAGRRQRHTAGMVAAQRKAFFPMPAEPARRFLFLQGPPGPFFRLLGAKLAAAGATCLRLNLNGGDAHDWPRLADGRRTPAWRGPAHRWPPFIEAFLRDHAITDLVLFGDCRPLHMVARQMAQLAGIRVHVFEEGYIRPNWLTLEQGGVNGHSPLLRDAAALLAAGTCLPPPPDLPPIGAHMGRRVADSWGYFGHMLLRAPLYPFHRSHRPGSIVLEGLGWALKYLRRAARQRQTERALAGLAGRPYFLFPLQLSADYQIRAHSPFAHMAQAADHVLASFAAHAPADALLVVKDHPLDATLAGWGGFLARRARALGLAARIIHVPGGDLAALALMARGVVVVNSTAATFALAEGVAVKALGTALYDLPGITHQGPLASFWAAPQAPDPQLYGSFCRVLHRHCLVRGGLASRSAIAILVQNAAARLLAPTLAQTAQPRSPIPAAA